MPDFKVANAVVHFDEASPHMHVVGVPIGRGFKRGLETKVSKRSVFTPKTLENMIPVVREFARLVEEKGTYGQPPLMGIPLSADC